MNPTLKSILLILMFIAGAASAQTPAGHVKKPKAELYYFHPTERCPIDQSIEEVTRKLMQTDFAARIKDGSLVFKVVNTEDMSQAKLVNKFEINAQALYLVTWPEGKEHKNDLTEFAFSTAHNNPGKFKSGLKQELLNALK